MATHLSRKDLKQQDAFSATVEGSFDSIWAHKRELFRYGGAALAVIIIVGGAWYYRMAQTSVREQTLGEAMTIYTATVGTTPQPGLPNFPSQAAKDDAVVKSFTKITQDFSGSKEAYVAEYYLATQAADSGKADDARREYQDVVAHADPNYASLAKFALAQVDLASNHQADGLNLLKDLIDHPTDLVTKNQATITYAQAIAASKPDEARQLLQPISAQKAADGQPQAAAALAQIPQK